MSENIFNKVIQLIKQNVIGNVPLAVNRFTLSFSDPTLEAEYTVSLEAREVDRRCSS